MRYLRWAVWIANYLHVVLLGHRRIRNATDLAILFNQTLSNVQGCSATFDPATSALFLWDDSGTVLLGPALPGTGKILRNSQCALDTNGSYVSGEGNSLELILSLSFYPAFHGPQNLYTSAADASGGTTGWQKIGSWTPN